MANSIEEHKNIGNTKWEKHYLSYFETIHNFLEIRDEGTEDEGTDYYEPYLRDLHDLVTEEFSGYSLETLQRTAEDAFYVVKTMEEYWKQDDISKDLDDDQQEILQVGDELKGIIKRIESKGSSIANEEHQQIVDTLCDAYHIIDYYRENNEIMISDEKVLARHWVSVGD